MTDTPPTNPLVTAKTLTPCELVRAEIEKYSGWDVDTMTAIAKAENRSCDPTRHNLTMSENHGSCVGSYGVLQVGCLHYNGEDVDDLATNVAIAYRVWQSREKWGSGYEAWTMYNNGGYLKWL